MSYAAVAETHFEPAPAVRRPLARPNVLLASLAAAAVTITFSGAAIGYALTHIPEVDPAAQPTPVAAIAEIAAEAATAPGKLEVLTPPVYGPNIVSEAPAMPFVPVNAKVKMDAVDLQRLADADGVTPPPAAVEACDDPCGAQAGYVAREASDEVPSPPEPREANAGADDDDDGNAPPPPDMAVN
jgi:hypothetical protein